MRELAAGHKTAALRWLSLFHFQDIGVFSTSAEETKIIGHVSLTEKYWAQDRGASVGWL